MPITIEQRDCVSSDGKHGTHVVLKDGQKVSCHSNINDAMAEARIRIANAPELSASQKRDALNTL